MKITETEKGNIKIVMSREEAASLSEMLNRMTMHDYERFSSSTEPISILWDLLNCNKHLL